jgi:hypothetical protein
VIVEVMVIVTVAQLEVVSTHRGSGAAVMGRESDTAPSSISPERIRKGKILFISHLSPVRGTWLHPLTIVQPGCGFNK